MAFHSTHRKPLTFGHYVVCFLIWGFWLLLYIFKHLAIICVCPSIYKFWLPLWFFKHMAIAFLSFLELRLLITPLISSNIWPLYLSVLQFTDFDYSVGICKRLSIVLSVLRFTASDNLFGIFKLFVHYIVCTSSICGFWFPLWYVQTFEHCVVCPSIFRFCHLGRDLEEIKRWNRVNHYIIASN